MIQSLDASAHPVAAPRFVSALNALETDCQGEPLTAIEVPREKYLREASVGFRVIVTTMSVSLRVSERIQVF